MSEMTLPNLAFSNPLCPVCLEETDPQDDGWACFDCGIEWAGNGENPEWLYPEDGQCASTLTRKVVGLSLEAETFRCMKTANHDVAEHRTAHLLAGWKDVDPGVSEVAE